MKNANRRRPRQRTSFSGRDPRTILRCESCECIARRRRDPLRQRGPVLGSGSRVHKKVVRGFSAGTVLMYTISRVTRKLLAPSADRPRRKFFSARPDEWTSLVHLTRVV